MAFQCEFFSKQSYALVETSGTEENVEEIMGYATGISDYCTSHNLRKALLDERQLEIKASLGSEFQAAVKVSENFLGTLERIASVPSEKARISRQHVETFLQNRGMIFRCFKTIEEAEQWLLEE